MYKVILPFILLSFSGFGQKHTSVSMVDFVKVKDNKFAETIYYYENNWKLYREEALDSNYISGYSILKTSPDSIGGYDLILITEYPDDAHFNLAEKHFQGIIKRLRPNGPILLNDLKPNEFRLNLYGKKAETLIDSK